MKKKSIEFAMVIHGDKIESGDTYMVCTWDRMTGDFTCREVIPGAEGESILIGSHKGACRSRWDFRGIIKFYANYWDDHIIYIK